VLSGAGAGVHLVARTAGDLDRAASVLTGATAHVCDVTDAEAVARVTADIAARTGGAPDILVNNAGIFPLALLGDLTDAELSRTLDANLVAPFRVLRAFLPAMRTRGSGHVVTLGSVADRTILPGNGAYAASKYGQRALHETLRAETRGTGIRASLVSPAATDTPIWDPVDPDNRPGFPKRAEMLRAEQVADAVLWVVTRPAAVNVDELRLSAT
jgi:NADP-dependent 3-hydroxy acid dehydrogenase YdfG